MQRCKIDRNINVVKNKNKISTFFRLLYISHNKISTCVKKNYKNKIIE